MDNDAEYLKMVEQESLIFEAQECIAEAMRRTNTSRSELAARLGVSRAAVTQTLSDGHNMTLRTVADYLHALGFRATMKLNDA